MLHLVARYVCCCCCCCCWSAGRHAAAATQCLGLCRPAASAPHSPPNPRLLGNGRGLQQPALQKRGRRGHQCMQYCWHHRHMPCNERATPAGHRQLQVALRSGVVCCRRSWCTHLPAGSGCTAPSRRATRPAVAGIRMWAALSELAGQERVQAAVA